MTGAPNPTQNIDERVRESRQEPHLTSSERRRAVTTSARLNSVNLEDSPLRKLVTMTAETQTSTDWWMQGNYAPITEEVTYESLPVVGKIPSALRGSYLRNGFNPPGAVPFHWFFGAGMVHGFDFADGCVAYRNRYVRTPYFEQDMDLMTAVGDLTFSPANTNIVRHAGRLLALEEAHFPWEIGTDLSTLQSHNFDGKLNSPMTAHPKICPKTGEMLFFGYQFFQQPYLTYHRVDARGTLVQSEVIDIPRPVMMHDFTITENHAIFFDLPIVFDMDKGGFHFDRDAGARVGVMPRNGTNATVRWFEVEACSVFHCLNSYERGDEIVIQVCRAKSLMDSGMNDLADQSVLWQWTLDMVTGGVAETQLYNHAGDFPRIDDRRVGQPNRFGYIAGLRAAATPTFSASVFQYDLDERTAIEHSFGGTETHVFEPVFAPAHATAAENEGWILVLSHNDTTDVTTLNILDAQHFAAAPVATIALPQRIPFGAHGNWMPAD